jgi:hypothetical protein
MGGFDESDQKAQSWVGAFQEEQQNAPVLGDPRTNQRRGKRVLDLAVACPLLLLGAPLMIGLTILIRLSSRGPAIIRQIRIGQNERPFTMFKFRTMYLDADDTPLRQMNIRGLLGANQEPAMASSNWRQTGGLRTWGAFFGGSGWTSSHNCSMCFAATCQWSGLGHHCRKCWHWIWSMFDRDRYGLISGPLPHSWSCSSIEPLGKSRTGGAGELAGREGYAC